MSDLCRRLQSEGEPVAQALGVELVQVQFVKEGGAWFLRYLLDKPGGISIDDCERFSRAVEKTLDAEDPIPHQYTLEVSSAGLDRPLLKLDDFRRFAGRELTVRLYQPIQGRKQFQARLLGLTPAGEEPLISMEIEGCGRVDVPLTQIARAKLVPEL